MTNRKLKGPSHFCEWVVGTTIESALRPIAAPKPKPNPPKNRKREVVRVQVTTDDESEEDTVRITYPRTGRTTPPSPPDPEPEAEAEAEAESEPEPEPTPIVTEAKTVIKKVRFKDGPIKSALKQTVITTPVESSDETSESGTESESEPESDSSQSETMSSSDATDSDTESSDASSKQRKKRRRQRQRQKQIEADSESDWDSDPDPTCKCHRCVKGREILRRIGKKKSKDTPPPSPETSESEEEPPKHKQKAGKKKKGTKKVKEPEPDPDPDASDSAKDTSESEPEIPAPKKQRQSNKKQKQGSRKGKKNQEPASEPGTSESEPDTPKKNKKQQQKANAKKGGKKTKNSEPEPEETDGETSESAKETEDEAEPEEKPKQQNKGKQKNKKKQNDNQVEQANNQSKRNKKKQKAGKETNKDSEAPQKPEAEEQTAEPAKEQDQGKFRNMKSKDEEQPKYRDGVKKGNYPEGLPGPHMRRPQLIEPIRAQVIQTERVIETPEDPAPNAYYDSEHNVMRVYHGPVYGNHQNNALYPERNGFNRPLPVGTPHPMQNPYYYGFNNPNFPQMPPYHQNYAGIPPPEAYSHIPITQTMPPPPWYGTAGPPGHPLASAGYQDKTAPAAPAFSKDKASQNNNVGPPSLTGKDNPYLPKRNKSQFSAWGSQGPRTASKEHSQPAASVRAGSNNWGGSNNNDQGNIWNDGANDTQNGQSSWDAAGQDNNNSNNGNDKSGSGTGDNQNNNWEINGNQNSTWETTDNQASTDWNNDRTQETTQNGGWAIGSNKSNETVRKAGAHWGDDTFPGASGDWEQQKDGVSSVGQGADNNVGVWGDDDGNGNGTGSGNGNENEPPVSTGGDGGADNVMPGTWVDTPALSAGPEWGDTTAAQDTHGAAENW